MVLHSFLLTILLITVLSNCVRACAVLNSHMSTQHSSHSQSPVSLQKSWVCRWWMSVLCFQACPLCSSSVSCNFDHDRKVCRVCFCLCVRAEHIWLLEGTVRWAALLACCSMGHNISVQPSMEKSVKEVCLLLATSQSSVTEQMHKLLPKMSTESYILPLWQCMRVSLNGLLPFPMVTCIFYSQVSTVFILLSFPRLYSNFLSLKKINHLQKYYDFCF